MKKLTLTILTCLIFLSPNMVLSETMKDLVQRPKWDGLYYKKFSQVPFTGRVTGLDQGLFKNGKKVGSWVRYHENGQLYEQGNYKDGKEEGVWVEYYRNGRLRSKLNFKNGKMEGKSISYNRDGTVFTVLTGTYKNDKKISD